MRCSNPCWRRSPGVWLFLFVNWSFALPTATPFPSALQDLDLESGTSNFVTMYGFLDSAFRDEGSPPGRPALAHLSKVFIAMAQTGAAALPLATGAVELAQDVPLIEPSLLSSAEEAIISTPPKQGPGLVMLTSQVFRPSSQPTSTSNTTMNASSTTAVNHSGSSSRVVILGSVVGGILVVTLCLFLLLGLKRNRKLLYLRKSSKSATGKGKQENGISSESFVSRSVLRRMNNQTSREAEKSGSESPNEKDNVADSPSQLPPPSSKFSVCSTEYLSCSPRESALSSGSDSSTVKATGAIATPPARPPRPPTADSPILSDSVYLACSDKPYVIVAPQPLTEAELKSIPESQRILTPAEFLALHVPEILSSLPSLPSSKFDKEDGLQEAPARRILHTRNRSSNHSRTKSEPVLNAEERNSKPLDGEEDDEDSYVRLSFVQRLIQHRRSRSASGWAYPNRLRSRRRKADA